MIYGSVCSGIEAATVAWDPLGWDAAWLSEIEKFPSAVLAHHYPEIPNLGDMTKLHENKIFQESRIDLLVGGTPCQSFSVAGLRKGLDDPRGNLALEFLRLVDISKPRWFVWENVPGVLSSSRGRDFGSFLGAIQQLGYGFAYRILDAQYFGVPQRRRRVFVVGYLGDWRPAAAVLFESESLRGNPAKSGKKRKAVAALTSTGVGTCGADDNQAQAGHLIPSWWDGGQTAQTLDAVLAKGQTMPEKNRFPAVLVPQPICFSAKDYGADAGNKAPTLRSGGHTTSHANAGVMPAVCITGNKTHALKADGFDGSEDGTGRGQPIVAVETGPGWWNEGSTVGTLRAEGENRPSRPSNVIITSCVRRLTPKECERLQGFPDDYTLIPTRKKAADGPRYKALGNSMAVPVMRWIGQRIQMVEDIINNR